MTSDPSTVAQPIREQIEAYRVLYAKNLNHEVPQLRQAAVEQIAICDLALSALSHPSVPNGRSAGEAVVGPLA